MNGAVSEVRWHAADLADAILTGIESREASLRDEQAVHGLDALDEVSLHPILADAIAARGFGVAREERYVSARTGRSKRSEGMRCDLVLTPEGRPLEDPAAEATLFQDPTAVPLQEAFWLEVKVVAQHTESGPNTTWASELLGTVRRDVSKVGRDASILHAGLLIILWTDTYETARHDFIIWQDRCLEKGMPIGAPVERTTAISDRLGNNCCTIRIYPVHHL